MQMIYNTIICKYVFLILNWILNFELKRKLNKLLKRKILLKKKKILKEFRMIRFDVNNISEGFFNYSLIVSAYNEYFENGLSAGNQHNTRR